MTYGIDQQETNYIQNQYCKLRLTVAWAAIRAASILRPGGPGAQKETLIWFPASRKPLVAC